MVCCASYWARHEIDEAGRTGSSLQKILFFLSALTMVSFLTFNPMTIACSTLALLVYGVGIHGAQKRNERALFFYGTVSLCGVIATLVVVACGLAFLAFAGLHHHGGRHHHNNMMAPLDQHAFKPLVNMRDNNQVMPSYNNVVPAQTLKHRVYAKMAEHGLMQHRGFILVSPDKKEIIVVDERVGADAGAELGSHHDLKKNGRRNRHSQPSDAPMAHHSYHITTLGYFVLAGLAFFSVLVFALKVRSIRLAFRMRRLLRSLARQRLPTTRRTASAVRATPLVEVAAPSTPAPARRRDCPRCTYVNASDVARCAMCDSALPFAAAPADVRAPPKVYVPGALYPLNEPLN